MADFLHYRAHIDALLEARENVYPVRDSSHARLQEGIDAFTSYLLNKRVHDVLWQPAQRILDNAVALAQRPVFVCGAMKSGTTLLIRLLDDHPEMAVLPGDSHFADVFLGKDLPFEELAIHWMRRLINPTGQRPFWFLGRDEQAYLDFLHYLNLFLTRSQQMSSVAALVCSIFHQRLLHGKIGCWVEKTPHTELRADTILSYFPQAKFVHVLRDPRSNFVSLKRLAHLRGQSWTAMGTAKIMNRLMRAGLANAKKISSYHFIRFEDLLACPEQTMAELTGFLEIECNESLLSPTENGLPARSNSMYKQDRTFQAGVVNQEVARRETWRTELSWSEKHKLYRYTVGVAKDCGYSYGWVGPLYRMCSWA